MFVDGNSSYPSIRFSYSNGEVCESNSAEYLTLIIDIVCNKNATQAYPNATYIVSTDPCT